MKIIATNTPPVEILNGIKPILWGLPETSLQLKRNPFFIPSEKDNFTAKLYWVVRINRLGKNIAERFAHRYYDEVTIGTIFCNTTKRNNLLSSGHPTYEAYAFDGAGTIGLYKTIHQINEIKDFTISGRLCKNEIDNICPQIAHQTIDKIVHYASQGSTIRQGDLLFIEIDQAEYPLILNTNILLCLNKQKILEINIK